jgi:hypothetical protein
MSDKLSGFLVWSEPSALRSVIPRLGRLSKQVELGDGWRKYDYVVDEQIPRIEMPGQPPFIHPLYLKWGNDRLIVLSNHYRVCDHFLDRDLRLAIVTFRKADIAVHDFVLAMVEFRDFADKFQQKQPGESSKPPIPQNLEFAVEWHEFNDSHSLGYGSARTDAFGGNLQRIEFEGDDLAIVSLFISAIPVVRFRACGLRRRTLDDKGFPGSYELLRIAKTGFVSFTAPQSKQGQRERFREVEVLLRNLNRFGFIK